MCKGGVKLSFTNYTMKLDLARARAKEGFFRCQNWPRKTWRYNLQSVN